MNGCEHGQQPFLCLHNYFLIVGQRTQFTTLVKCRCLSVTLVSSHPMVNLPLAIMMVSEFRTGHKGSVTQFSDTYVLPGIKTNKQTNKTRNQKQTLHCNGAACKASKCYLMFIQRGSLMQFSSTQLTEHMAINMLQEEKNTSQAPNSNML